MNRVTRAFPLFSKQVKGIGFLVTLALAALVFLPVPPAHAALVIDGHGTCRLSASSCSISVTTSNSNDVIIIDFATGNSASAGSCSGGSLSWTTRISNHYTLAGAGNPWAFEAWAVAAAPLSAVSITCTVTSGTSISAMEVGISGANTGSPFDASGTLPLLGQCNSGQNSGTCSNSGTTETLTYSYTTANSPDFLVGYIAADGTLNTCPSQTGTQIDSFASNGYAAGCNGYQVILSPQSASYAMSETANAASPDLWGFFDAITAGVAGTCSSVAVCITPTQTETSGNVEVIAIQWSTQLTTITSVTDSLGNVWKAQTGSTSCDASGCINGHVVQTSLWDSLITVGGSAAVTITFTASTTNIGFVFYSVANVSPTPNCVAGSSTITGVTTTVITTFSPCPSLPQDTDIASIAGIGAFALSGGAGYTLSTSIAAGNFGAEIANINGNTVFPASISSATVISEAAMVLAPVSQGGNAVLGSCPNKNTATNALVNSTTYFWTGTALANEQVNTLQTEVASVNSGHVTSETLALGVYATPAAGGVSASNPLQLVGNSFKFFVLTPTSAPQSIVWAPNVNLGSNGIVAGATIAIAIQGNSKILINSSSLSGMLSASGLIGAGNQFTSLSSTATQLFFCGQLSFQTVVTTTVTITTTTVGSTTTTQTVTTTIGNAPNPSTLGFWFIPLLFIMLGIGITTGVGEGVHRVQNAPMESGTLVFLVILGMFLGSWMGTLAQVTPLGLSLLLTAFLVVVAWRR